MILGTDQLHISSLKPPGSPVPTPGMPLIDRARHYGLESLPTIKARITRPGTYEILSGLLTWRVAQVLRIDDISVQCVELSDDAVQEIVQDDFAQSRVLDPITQAEMLHEQIHIDGVSRRELGERYGFSRSQLSHTLRLLQLEPQVREWVRAGKLPAGKAKILVGLPNRDQYLIAKSAISNRSSNSPTLNTRQVEKAARDARRSLPVIDHKHTNATKDSDTLLLEETLSKVIGNSVSINWNKTSQFGTLSISYHNLDELQGIIERLQNSDR